MRYADNGGVKSHSSTELNRLQLCEKRTPGLNASQDTHPTKFNSHTTIVSLGQFQSSYPFVVGISSLGKAEDKESEPEIKK